MLKIKDNVDLKELEKFGFEDGWGVLIKLVRKHEHRDSEMQTHLIINYEDNDRQIKIRETYRDDSQIYSSKVDGWIEEYIDDLIKAGLIEKVED